MARLILLAAFLSVLGGCVYLPATTVVFDKECRVYRRHMSLELHQLGVLAGCGNEACVAALALLGAVTATSAVVSGSIVLVGNVVYWLEWQGRCAGGGAAAE